MRKYLHGDILGIICATKYTYRTTTVMKVETDIISSTTASLMRQDVILVIMYVETF